MNVGLFAERTAGLSPNLLAVVEEGMREGGGDRRERQAVAEREGGRQKERRVLVVLVHVEGLLVVQDTGHVVALAQVVERMCRRDGHELRVPGVRVVQDGSDNPCEIALSIKRPNLRLKYSQKKNTIPAVMLASAHHGVASGEPM